MTIAELQHAVAQIRARKPRDVGDVIAALSQTAKNWLAPNSPWRKRAVAEAPGPTGFSEAMVNEAIDLTFSVLTAESFGELVEQELKDRHAVGPPLIAHFLAGNVPPPGIVSICCGLLLRSANIVRVSSNDPVFPKLFVESLREVDADLAGSVAVVDWPKEETALTRAAMAEANAIIAYGSDTTIAELRKLTPAGVRFFGYGHRVSFGVITREAIIGKELAEAAAFDASVYDQQGCLSPHVFYVEKRAREFASMLAEAMAAYQARVPRGKLTTEESAAIAQLRQAYEFRSASDQRVAVWTGDGWTLICNDDLVFTPSCLNRSVFVKPIDSLKCVIDSVRGLAGRISTIGLAPMNEHAVAFTAELATLAARRVCPIGHMQRPSLSWHHDGRPDLADLVRWTDVG